MKPSGKLGASTLKGSAASKARQRAKAVFFNTSVKEQRKILPTEVKWALVILLACCFLAGVIRFVQYLTQ